MPLKESFREYIEGRSVVINGVYVLVFNNTSIDKMAEDLASLAVINKLGELRDEKKGK